MHPLNALAGLAVTGCLGLAAVAGAQDARYGVADWPEAGHGNHRAVIHVDQPAEAVWAHIEWRRRDRQPEAKDIHVFDAATGQRVTNLVRVDVQREFGDLVFQPATAPGDYWVYYLPYNPGTGNFDDPGTYFKPEDTADAAWVQRNGLDAEGLKVGAWRSLPAASLVEIQARGNFNRMDPMEVTATPAEVQALVDGHPGAPYLLFPEGRRDPIRMLDDLPLKWIRSGPAEGLAGEAQPGEYYPCQVGVFACRQGLANVQLEFSDLRGADGRTIPAAAMNCINLGGTDWLGHPFSKVFDVPQGLVRPLWVGVQVPADAVGRYEGTLTLRPENAPATALAITLDVSGAVLEDGGVSDLWRMSRLKWLDSTLGLDDEVIPPFTPLRVAGDSISCIGRQVRFGAGALPVSIRSGEREVLAAPMALSVETAAGVLPWQAGGDQVVSARPGKAVREATASADGFGLSTTVSMEADGCLTYQCRVTAQRDADVKDIRLDIPYAADVAKYLMGMGKRGGFRPPEWHWKWNLNRADNLLWVGDADAGMQLKLLGDRDVWDTVSLTSMGLPVSWDNGGQGGASVTEEGDQVRVRVFSGPRTMHAGDALTYRFRLLVTPLKPIDPRHWDWRYGDTSGDANILHIHHATPENPYINYPFLTTDILGDTVKQVRSTHTRVTDRGKLTYPAAGNIRLERGAVHIWARICFDPTAGGPLQSRYNQELFDLDFPNQDQVGFYWNVDDRGMRAYLREGDPSRNVYPVLFSTHSPDWREGDRHLLTLSWGDRLSVFVDGQLVGQADHAGLLPDSLEGAKLAFQGGGFALDAIKLVDQPYEAGQPAEPVADDHTLLLDSFSAPGDTSTQPERSAAGGPGTITGVVEWAPGAQGKELVFSARREEVPPKGVNFYYTVRELSNHVAEMWPLRSLGDEVFRADQSYIFSVEKAMFGQAGGGYPWLQEHLVNGYVVAWRQPLWGGDHDAAIGTQGLSRWHNYYVEGLRWMMQRTGVDGLYLDGIGYDREIMKRVAKVMVRTDPNSRINFHGGNDYDFMDLHVSPANHYMEHFPYISNLWFGEMYDYNRSPDYWLVEISGIPFGLTSEMLNYENGGNAYRGMVYGMTGRQHPSAPAMWRFWDEFGIQDAEWLGYWDPRCPVKTDRDDLLATVYRKPGKSLIALAHWSGEGRRNAASVQPTPLGPEINGPMDPSRWHTAARLTGFTQFGGQSRADDQTQVWVTYDSRKLYVGFQCFQASGAPRAEVTQRDGPVYTDDAVEIFIQPDPDKPEYFQFVGNSRGAFLDGRGTDGSWNGPWEYRASPAEGCWFGALAIPWEALGMAGPQPGQQLGFNVCRDQMVPAHALSCWSPLTSSFHDPARFGRLTLDPDAPSTDQTEDETGEADREVKVRLTVDWQALGLDPARTVLRAPAISAFQGPAEFAPGAAIPIEPGKGWLLVAEPR
jgi:hypothetical protein